MRCSLTIHPLQRPVPLRYSCYVQQAMVFSCNTSYSDVVKNTSRSKEKTDNMLTDKTEQVTFGMIQSLSIQTINTVLWPFNVSWQIAIPTLSSSGTWTDHLFLFTSSLKINTNEHQKVTCFNHRNMSVYTISSSSPPTLTYSSVGLSDKMADFVIMIGQIACQSNLFHLPFCFKFRNGNEKHICEM